MRLNNKGDTIVEVLIAVAVVGTVLTGAYASARRSLNGVRTSQERAEALKATEGQLERLKYYVAVNPTAAYTGTFCMDTSNAKVPTTNSACNNQGPGLRYSYSITQDAMTKVFTVKTSWNQINGGTGQLSLAYKAEI